MPRWAIVADKTATIPTSAIALSRLTSPQQWMRRPAMARGPRLLFAIGAGRASSLGSGAGGRVSQSIASAGSFRSGEMAALFSSNHLAQLQST